MRGTKQGNQRERIMESKVEDHPSCILMFPKRSINAVLFFKKSKEKIRE